MSVKGTDSEVLPRESFWVSPEFSLIADAVIVDNGLGRGTVPPAVFRALLGVGVSGFSLFRRFRVWFFGEGAELYWKIPEVDELSGVKLDEVWKADCQCVVDDVCCQAVGSASGDAVCEKGVPCIFTGIPGAYWGIPLRDGDPEDIILSVINLRDAARPCLGESHDISVGINALQILVRLGGRV